MVLSLLSVLIATSVEAFFSYDNIDAWQELSELCVSTASQSPKDFHGDDLFSTEAVTFEYVRYPPNVNINRQMFLDPNNHNSMFLGVNIPEDEAPVMQFNGVEYIYDDVHAHFPSEHRKLGEWADAEFHFVHKTFDGSGVAVIGFLVDFINTSTITEDDDIVVDWSRLQIPNICDSGDEFREINVNTEMMCAIPGNTLVPDERPYESLYVAVEAGLFRIFGLDMYDELPAYDFVNYTGSLTTPPCTEGVQWFVAQTVVKAVVADDFDYSTYSAAFARNEIDRPNIGNYRPTNPQADIYYNATIKVSDQAASAAAMVSVVGAGLLALLF